MRWITLSIILAFLLCLSVVGEAYGIPQKHRQSGKERQVTKQNLSIHDSRLMKVEASKIMSILQRRIVDPKVLKKTRDKLLTLPVGEVRLLSSLCDRIPGNERTAKSNVLFSLVTTLIVLS